MTLLIRLICLAMCIAPFIASAQKTTRAKLKPIVSQCTTRCAVDTTVIDSLNRGAIAFSGYEKALRSTQETVFVTNRGNDTICGMMFVITYYDMAQRQLHARDIAKTDIIAPGETRQVAFKSWDPHKVFYYHLTVPGRVSGNATPYNVKVTPKWIVTPTKD